MLEGMDLLSDLPEPSVRETLLSKPPRPKTEMAVLLSLASIAIPTALYWKGIGAAFLLASRDAVFAKLHLWALLTTIFIHQDVRHLVSNALPLAFLCYLVYGTFGPSLYLSLCLLGGALANSLALYSYEPGSALLGASGVVYLLAGFWLISYLFIERRFPVGRRFFRALGFGAILLLPTAIEPNVSYRTHALGFAIGALAGILHFRARKRSIRAHEILDFD